eukprot:TRINITY_DN3812_c0_g5_i2.p1 TRINITY_DN3812_c0_g5~~TRINITY_DN3812_c0_g5_i2.p1  ORF type:complete len:373 (-),score=149.93 TRINITY_DN3812_c0_g5_i2:494-1612(-)
MTKEDLIAFIKSYASEFGVFSDSCREYHRKAEERLESAAKNEEELKALQAYMEKSQSQLQALNENNDKSITLNNDLQNRVRDLSSELSVYKEVNEKLQADVQDKKTKIEKLEEELRKKEELIAHYDKRFDELEEGAQSSAQKITSSEEKIVKLEKFVERQKKELEDLMRDNESITLKKISNTNEFAQEKVELKKAIAVAERTIGHLIKEKHSLELKYGLLQRKLDKTGMKSLSKEVQTDDSDYKSGTTLLLEASKEEAGKLSSRLLMKEEELHAAKEFAKSLLEELGKMRHKLDATQEQNTMNEKRLEETQALSKKLEEEKDILAKENQDLRRRREQATIEMIKLRQNITRKSSKARSGSKTASQAVNLLLP